MPAPEDVRITMQAAQREAKRRMAGRALHAHAVRKARKVRGKPATPGGVGLAYEVRGDIMLGRDGSKWRHGWIPLNPVAAAIKAKKWKGHGGTAPKAGEVRRVSKTRIEAPAITGRARGKSAPRQGRIAKPDLSTPAGRRAASGNVGGRSVLGSHGNHGSDRSTEKRTGARVNPGATRVGDRVSTSHQGKTVGGTVMARDPGDHGPTRLGVTVKLDNGNTVRRRETALRKEGEKTSPEFRERLRARAASSKAHAEAMGVRDKPKESAVEAPKAKRATKDQLDELFGTKAKEAVAAAKAEKLARQEQMLPGEREVNGQKIVVRGKRDNPLVPADAYAVEHRNGATLGYIKVKDGKLHIGAQPFATTSPQDAHVLEEHPVKNVKEALTGLHASHTLNSQRVSERNAAEKAARDAAQASATAKRNAEMTDKEKARHAADVAFAVRERARGEAASKRIRETVNGLKPTVTKKDSPTKVKQRDALTARLAAEPKDVHHYDVVAKDLQPGQAVKIKVGKYEAQPQGPHTATHGVHGQGGENLTRYKLDEAHGGHEFTADYNGKVTKVGQRRVSEYDPASRRYITSFEGGSHPNFVMDEVAKHRAGDTSALFAQVAGDVIYRHNGKNGGSKHVGTEEVTGHVVHADNGVVHVSDGKRTYSALPHSGGRMSSTEFVPRDPVADKELVRKDRAAHAEGFKDGRGYGARVHSRTSGGFGSRSTGETTTEVLPAKGGRYTTLSGKSTKTYADVVREADEEFKKRMAERKGKTRVKA